MRMTPSFPNKLTMFYVMIKIWHSLLDGKGLCQVGNRETVFHGSMHSTLQQHVLNLTIARLLMPIPYEN